MLSQVKQFVATARQRLHKQTVEVDEYRERLLDDMARAVENIRTAMQKYEAALRHVDADNVAYSQMLFNQIDAHITEYLNLRLQYEAAYGNLEEYYRKFTRIRKWQEEGNHPCLFLHRFKTAIIPSTSGENTNSVASV